MENGERRTENGREGRREQHIFLVGFMGSGKTTVGELLADRLGCGFWDLDERIERQRGLTIAEIFREKGEEAFRRMEQEALAELAALDPAVVALGGGAFSRPQSRELVRRSGLSVWLQVDLEEAAQRCLGLPERPLAQDRQRFSQLFHRRLPDYSQADIHISTRHKTPEEVCQAIVDALLRKAPTSR